MVDIHPFVQDIRIFCPHFRQYEIKQRAAYNSFLDRLDPLRRGQRTQILTTVIDRGLCMPGRSVHVPCTYLNTRSRGGGSTAS